ncbi:MAG: carbohydrate binding family 9 domain-containing protein [Gemmatimonadota bacterium]|nr:carbohydrate binding family 9 domain-containing protein [Gemmatimonadota bacterium]
MISTAQRSTVVGSLLLAAQIFAVTLPVLLPSAAAAQTPAGSVDPTAVPRPVLRAHAARSAIVLDGHLDEPDWIAADSTEGHFWTVTPEQGMPASERTVVRILYDGNTVYVGARMYDSEPHLLVSAGLEQDFSAPDSDIFGIALDTYLDRQNAFVFAINPAGAIWDAQAFSDGNNLNTAWEGIVEVRTSVDDQGWTAEVAIPVTTLRFNPAPGGQEWGLNFSRIVRKRNEYSTWAALPRQFRAFRMSLAGTVVGLPDFQQGLNLQVKPYLTAGRSDGRLRPTGSERYADGGLDLKWSLTPRMTLDVTAFTDFSQVEVDEEQVNLTRFSLFFPEKRDFFLENDGIFTFSDVRASGIRGGSGPENFKLFHSRRIGLADDRSTVPIAAGVRLNGRMGGYEIGLLEMQTLDERGTPAENFAVARVRRSVLRSSDVGFMLVSRQATSPGFDDFSRAAGIDANFRFDRFQVNAYAAATDDAATAGDRTSASVQLGWRDPVLDFSVLGKHVGDAFAPGVGFVSRTGVDQWFATGGAHFQQPFAGVTEINPHLDATEYYALSGTLESRAVTPGLTLVFADGARLTAQHTRSFEHLENADTILGIEVVPGSYDFDATSVTFQTSGGRRVSGSVAVTRGGFFDGDRRSERASVTLRPNAHWFFQGSAQRNRITLGGQPRNADLFSARIRYGHDTRTFLSTLVQYNRTTEELITNFRFNLIHAPLSDVYLVFSERRDLDAGAGIPAILDRGVSLKVTRLVQF